MCGILGLWLVFSHVLHFDYPTYFFKANPDIKTYVGTNVVCASADFCFFTYLTIILFGIWCVLVFVANAFKIQKLEHFLTTDFVVCFVFENFLFTTILYTIFELTSGNITFGFYANVPLAWHNLFTNILCHYVLFACSVVLFSKTKCQTQNTKTFRPYIFVSTFLILYYTIVKLVGEFAFQIRWFPYVIFDAKSFGAMFGLTNYAWCITLLAFTCILLFFVYILIFKFLLHVKHQQTKKVEV